MHQKSQQLILFIKSSLRILSIYIYIYISHLFFSSKVRQIIDCYGQNIAKANPSDPVTLMGWRSLPNPGEVAIEVNSEVCFLIFYKKYLVQ